MPHGLVPHALLVMLLPCVLHVCLPDDAQAGWQGFQVLPSPVLQHILMAMLALSEIV